MFIVFSLHILGFFKVWQIHLLQMNATGKERVKMYIIKNAWKSITRNKARNILIGIVALVIAVSSCVALSIREAAQTAKEDTLADLTITAQIAYDRSSQMSNTMNEMKNGGTFNKGSFDFSSIMGESLTLDDYLKYTQAQSDGDSYYYNMTSSLNASGDLEAYNSSDSSTSGTTGSATNGNAMPQGRDMGKMSFSAQGDFSLTGYSSYQALMSMFGEDGTYTITDGAMFESGTDDKTCIISDELATFNDLSVGDVITLANPNYEDETYEFTICGIYTNSSSDAGSSMFSRSDPANNIYMNYETLKSVTDASEAAGNATDGNSVQLNSEIAFTYVFSEAAHYDSFSTAVYDLGLDENYKVSSQDLSAYESSITPLETLSTMAGWFFLIVLAIGGVILIVLNIFNLRERKYEVGVLTAIGMKKAKVAMQFVCELFTITFAAIILGAIIGSIASVPVTNKLLENQAASATASTEQISNNFGKDMSQGAPGMAQAGNTQSGNANTHSGTAGGNTAGVQGTQGNGNIGAGRGGNIAQQSGPVAYITSVSSATDLVVILELVGVGLVLTIISSLAAMITIMRYEPLQILSSRS